MSYDIYLIYVTIERHSSKVIERLINGGSILNAIACLCVLGPSSLPAVQGRRQNNF